MPAMLDRRLQIVAAAALARLAAATSAPGAKPPVEPAGKVVAVHDGDTITVLVDKQQVKVRLAAIDAPELGQDFGRNAKLALSAEVFGKAVRVESTAPTSMAGRWSPS